MKKTKLGKLYIWVPIMLLTLIFTSSAQAILFTFSDKDYLGGASWGTLEITAKDSDTLMISYTASPTSVIPKDSAVTGFGFNFSGYSPGSVQNPDPDSNTLKWYNFEKVSFPNPANGDEFNSKVKKSVYTMGVTTDFEGMNFNMSNGGLLPGQSDTYFLNFTNLGTIDLTKINLADFVSLTGIRLQALPGKINEGSLFLVGKQNQTSVPEPTTLLLFGTGLAFIGVLGRSRVKNN